MRASMTTEQRERTGVILATYGEPRVNSFAEQWVYSYRILRGLTRKVATIPAPMLPVIATARAFNRVRLWRENAFASPLEELHQRTVDALQARFDASRADVTVKAAYEFRRPGLAEAVKALAAEGCARIVVAPMYISEGDFTHGITRLGLEDAIATARWPRERLALCSLAADTDGEERLADVLAEHVLSTLRARDVRGDLGAWAVLLAAHGTIVTPLPGVDNGLRQAGRVLHRLKMRLRRHAALVRVGWLNHTRGGKWTTPSVPDALRAIRAHGHDKLVYFPWGFTTDNAETQLEGRVALREMEQPFERVEYLPCLNDGAAFVDLIAARLDTMVRTRAREPLGRAPADLLEPALSAEKTK